MAPSSASNSRPCTALHGAADRIGETALLPRRAQGRGRAPPAGADRRAPGDAPRKRAACAERPAMQRDVRAPQSSP
jgi:hypothetical protein